MLRLAALVASVLAAAALAGCERVVAAGAAIAAANPLRGFETRCNALPPAQVDVSATVATATERYDVPYAALTSRQKDASPHHRTLGLTEVEIRHASTIDFAGVDDGRGRACLRPSIRVELSASPVTVYVASEYRGDPCREPLIRAHEYRHVDVYRRYVEEAAPALAASLRARLGTAPHYGSEPEAVQRTLDRAIREELSRFMADTERELYRRNAEVDAPQEYESLGRNCG